MSYLVFPIATVTYYSLHTMNSCKPVNLFGNRTCNAGSFIASLKSLGLKVSFG